MTDNKNYLCDYCGKLLTWNNGKVYVYTNPYDLSRSHYCSKECVMKDNGLDEDYFNSGITFVFKRGNKKEK